MGPMGYGSMGTGGAGSSQAASSSGIGLGGAGILAGASFLSNYLQMKAQEEMERKKNKLAAMQSQQDQIGQTGDRQNMAMQNLINQYRAALIGG